MKKFIACLLLGTFLGAISPLLLAQQNQSTQRSNTEIEALKKRVSELEKQLQIVENVEKMDLQTKLAETNAKLVNAGVDKYKRELRDSNDDWLRGWSSWFLGLIGVFVAIFIGVGAVFWFWLRSTANKLIADTVEKNLDGFKEAVDAQDLIKNQLRILEKEHAASTLGNFIHVPLDEEYLHPEEIKALQEETLLQVFEDNNYHLQTIHKAAEVLSARKFPELVSPMLKLLNSFAHLDSDIDDFVDQHQLRNCVTFLGCIETSETHQALKRFLHHLLTEDPKHKNLFLTRTVFVLAGVSVKLDMGDSVLIVRRGIPHLKDLKQRDLEELSELARYFDIFNEPEGIKEILINHLEDEIPNMESLQKNVEDKCLELLQKHDPKFVSEWGVKQRLNDY